MSSPSIQPSAQFSPRARAAKGHKLRTAYCDPMNRLDADGPGTKPCSSSKEVRGRRPQTPRAVMVSVPATQHAAGPAASTSPWDWNQEGRWGVRGDPVVRLNLLEIWQPMLSLMAHMRIISASKETAVS